MKKRYATIIVAMVTVASVVTTLADNEPATASTPPPGAQVCHTSHDHRRRLLPGRHQAALRLDQHPPQGTQGQPTEVQFAANSCYQIDGMVFLRGLSDFVFDGQGAKFEQARVVNNELVSEPALPHRPAYCGFSRKYTTAAGSVPLGFDIMWFVEGRL
jgi:hypothetical protein